MVDRQRNNGRRLEAGEPSTPVPPTGDSLTCLAQLVSQNQQLINQLIAQYSDPRRRPRVTALPTAEKDRAQQLQGELTVMRADYFRVCSELEKVRQHRARVATSANHLPAFLPAAAEPVKTAVTPKPRNRTRWFGQRRSGHRHAGVRQHWMIAGVLLSVVALAIVWSVHSRSVAAPEKVTEEVAPKPMARSQASVAPAGDLPVGFGMQDLAQDSPPVAASPAVAQPPHPFAGFTKPWMTTASAEALRHADVGMAYLQAGQPREALNEFREAVTANPKDPGLRFSYASLLERTGQTTAALQEYRKVLQEQPDMIAAANNMAVILATNPDPTKRSGPEAIALAWQAAEQTQHQMPEVLETLAAAYAENGDYQAAVSAGQSALALAEQTGNRKLATEVADHLECFEAGRPVR